MLPKSTAFFEGIMLWSTKSAGRRRMSANTNEGAMKISKTLHDISEKRMSAARLLAGSAILIMFGTPAHAESAPSDPLPYDAMFDLGALGGNYSYPSRVNADGSVVVGFSNLTGDTEAHAFIWTPTLGMTDLGTLGGNFSAAYDVSADGLVVIGQSTLADGNYRAFRWTQSSGMVDLGTLGGNFSLAASVSSDGSAVVGQSPLADGNYRAFRWTESGGMVDLGHLGSNFSYARDVSANGSAVIGQSGLVGAFSDRAFRWTEGSGMVDLGTLGGASSNGSSISADGSVVVGGATLTGNSTSHAFRWMQSSGMVDLGTLGGDNSYAKKVSKDGSTVVGTSSTSLGDQHAFRWTEADDMVDLGTLGGNFSYGEDVSADGTVVVGYSNLAGEGGMRAFRWSQDGMVDLGTLSGGTYSYATAVSDDGSTVVGVANSADGQRAFIYRTQMQDFTNMIVSFGSLANDLEVATEYQRETATWLVERGCAMHDDQRFCLGAEGLLTFTSANINSAIDQRQDAAAKIMAGVKLAPALTLGLGAGIVDYRNEIGAIKPKNGYSYGGWLSFAPGKASLKGLKARVGLAMANQENQIERGTGLDNVEVTPGQTDIKTTVVQGELGYGIGVSGGAIITPLAGVTWQSSKMNTFQEAPGDFPASFAGQSFDTTYATAGLEFSIPANSRGRFTLAGKVDFDLDTDTIGLIGASEIPGMELFGVQSALRRHEVRGRIEAGYAQQVGPGVVSVNAQVATPTFGGHARFGIGVGFGVGF